MNLIIEDYIAIGLVFLTGIVKMLTNYVLWLTQNICGYATNMMVMEANPIARWILEIFKFELILGYMVFPAFVGAVYVYFRHKYKDKDRQTLRFFVVFLFFCFALNFFNDAGAVLGLLGSLN